MLRSLWSGVSGLIAHQYALDVEANNLANVNTVGFKYSRASFADMFYQTKQHRFKMVWTKRPKPEWFNADIHA